MATHCLVTMVMLMRMVVVVMGGGGDVDCHGNRRVVGSAWDEREVVC